MRVLVSQGKFEKVSNQAWAEGLKCGTHRLKQSWVEKRFDNLDEQGFPKPLPEDVDRPEACCVLPEHQLDHSYHAEEPGSLQQLSTWKLMVESGEMTEDALRECSLMPHIEYEVHGMLDFEGLEDAKDILTSPKKRKREAGLMRCSLLRASRLRRRGRRIIRGF